MHFSVTNLTADYVIHDPCLPVNRLEQKFYENVQFTLKGTGNLNACLRGVTSLLNKTSCTTKSPCAMHGLYQPEINFDKSEFYGFSEFYYTMEDILSIAGKYSSAKFKRTAQVFLSYYVFCFFFVLFCSKK